MRKTALRFTNSESPRDSLSLPQIERGSTDWLFDCEYHQHSQSTLATRRIVCNKLLWFLWEQDLSSCSTSELRQFLTCLSRGHGDANGQWGNPSFNRPVRPRTVHAYHGHLKTFFAWLVNEGLLDVSPMNKLAPPVTRSDQVQPFTGQQVEAVLTASRRSRHPRRDEAIVWFLVDKSQQLPSHKPALHDVNTKSMLAAMCMAGTRIEDKNALGGFAKSDKLPRPVGKMKLESSKVYLQANPNQLATYASKYKGMTLLLVNTTILKKNFRPHIAACILCRRRSTSRASGSR